MKIQINFDLLSKINDANTGLSLKRTVVKMFAGTVLTTSIALPFCMNDNSVVNDSLTSFFMILSAQTIYTIRSNKLFADKYKEIASIELNKFLHSLDCLDISVNYEELLNAYTYCTEYEELSDDSFLPKIVQKKYFVIPSANNRVDNDIFLIQEHVIGSDVYNISCGHKEKKLKLVLQKT